MVCACPTTERNLGMVSFRLDSYSKRCAGGSGAAIVMPNWISWKTHVNLNIICGSKSWRRAVLAPVSDEGPIRACRSALNCATVDGAQSLSARGGTLVPEARQTSLQSI